MSTTSHDHLTAETRPDPPNVEASWHTISDQRWKLRRFTSAKWSLDRCEYENNDHANVRCTALEATLVHATGATVYCQPFDPWEHQPGPTIYRKHRVLLRHSEYHDDDQVATLEGDTVPSASASDLLDRGDDPFAGAADMIECTDYETVRATDDYVERAGGDRGKGTNVESIDGALWATIGTARTLSNCYLQTRQWFFGGEEADD